MPKVLSTDPILSVPNATGVGLPNIPTVPNVPTMIMNDAHECARIRFCEFLDGRLKEPIISPINSRWRTAVILKIVLGPIFCFPTAFWASTRDGIHIDYRLRYTHNFIHQRIADTKRYTLVV